MKPGQIVSHFSEDKISSVLGELNSGQMKSVLREAGLSVKVPPGCVLPKARRKLWSGRILEGLRTRTEETAGELLYQWLLNHRRSMLMDFLDALEIKHVRGETEDSFTKTVPQERLVSEALKLMKKHDPQEVAAYVLYLDHHQESDSFSGQEEILAALGGGAE